MIEDWGRREEDLGPGLLLSLACFTEVLAAAAAAAGAPGCHGATLRKCLCDWVEVQGVSGSGSGLGEGTKAGSSMYHHHHQKGVFLR